MSPSLVWSNLLVYSLQIGLLVGLTAFVPWLLGLRIARARLAYLQVLLAVCLAMPLLRPWKQEAVTANVAVSTVVTAVQPVAGSHRLNLRPDELALLLLAAGILARLAWIAAGFRRLRLFRGQATKPPIPVSPGVDIRISPDVSSPVTFGHRRPVILLPEAFAALDPRMQDAVLCHELLHVERSDWLFTVAEELVRAVFWFHPAIWWILGEIQLAREEVVDREVVRRTRARDEYVDSLLAMAGAGPEPDLAPASGFLRKRHLRQRVLSIFKEVPMSKTRLVSALAAGIALLIGACWFVTGVLPLAAAPQVVADGAGIAVDLNGALLMHRLPVFYPREALEKGVEGTVTAQVRLDNAGNVVDATIVSGPDQLRRAVLQSVLSWHFTKDSAGMTRQVTIAFRLPAKPEAAATAAARTRTPVAHGQAAPPTIKEITITGLADQQRDELMGMLPVHVGDALTEENRAKFVRAVTGFDEHLVRGFMTSGPNEVSISISVPLAQGFRGMTIRESTVTGGIPAPAAAEVPLPPGAIRVGGNVQQTKLISQPHPVYPLLAKQAGIQGKVELKALIDKDGKIADLQVVRGHPLLVQAAMEAVRQWVYQPTLLNGQPVQVMTQIDVNFTLSK